MSSVVLDTVSHQWRARIGFGGLLAIGLVGVAYAVATAGADWLGVLVLFGLLAAVGAAGITGHRALTAWTFIVTGAIAVLVAIGRAAGFRPSGPFVVVLLVVGIAAFYRGTQYRRAS